MLHKVKTFLHCNTFAQTPQPRQPKPPEQHPYEHGGWVPKSRDQKERQQGSLRKAVGIEATVRML